MIGKGIYFQSEASFAALIALLDSEYVGLSQWSLGQYCSLLIDVE